MVCTPSNAAIDELLARIIENGVVSTTGEIFRPKLVRLGKPLEGAPSHICSVSLDHQVESIVKKDPVWAAWNKNIEEINQTHRALRDLEANFFNGAKAESKRALQGQLRKLRGIKVRTELHLNMKRLDVRRSILENADVVAATLSSSGQHILLDHISQHDIRFDTVIVDESGQATEPATLIPLRYGCKRLILVGDVRQLPAYVCSKPAERAGLGVSLFERLERAGHEVVMLTVRLVWDRLLGARFYCPALLWALIANCILCLLECRRRFNTACTLQFDNSLPGCFTRTNCEMHTASPPKLQHSIPANNLMNL